MVRTPRRLLCLLLVAAVCLTALQFTAIADDTAEKVTAEDVMAGTASPSELYPEIDKATVPDIICAEAEVYGINTFTLTCSKGQTFDNGAIMDNET